jgi:hypothetical protein
MYRRTLALALTAALSLFVLTAIAGAGTTISSKVVLLDAHQSSGDPNKTVFKIQVKSDSPKCANNRDVKFSERDQGTNDPFVKVAQGTTNDHGKLTKTIDTTGLPDVKVTALKKVFGKPGHRKTCTPASIILTAG